MSKYIDKDKVLEYIIFNVVGKDITCGELARAIESIPTIEVSEDCIGKADLIESFLADNECEREEAKACMCSLDSMLELIEDAPPVTPTERTGEWIEHDPKTKGLAKIYECPFCGDEVVGEKTNFCPNCGADMRGKKQIEM